MYKITELANKLGLSRTTLLYYEKLGIIRAARLQNGYRVYSEKDLQRLQLITHLHRAGLTLQESVACVEEKVDQLLLQQRLAQLEDEIAQKSTAKSLLEALLGISDTKFWHHSLEKKAPLAHFNWLKAQGFNEKEALHIRWLSKNMHQHENYMNDFNTIFEGLMRLGPGSEEDTLRALQSIQHPFTLLLEIGCGRGITTLL